VRCGDTPHAAAAGPLAVRPPLLPLPEAAAGGPASHAHALNSARRVSSRADSSRAAAAERRPGCLLRRSCDSACVQPRAVITNPLIGEPSATSTALRHTVQGVRVSREPSKAPGAP
jgi:hypothetical protein